MFRPLVRLAAPLLLALTACDLSAPVWNADYFFPVNFPDIQLADYAIAGQIPNFDLPFTTPVEQQDITGLLEEFLTDNTNAMTAEVITQSNTNVTAVTTISIAATQGQLFVPGASVTAQITVNPGVDTTLIQVDPLLLRDAVALNYQIQGTLRGGPGGTSVTATDRIKVDVNIFVNYQVSK